MNPKFVGELLETTRLSEHLQQNMSDDLICTKFNTIVRKRSRIVRFPSQYCRGALKIAGLVKPPEHQVPRAAIGTGVGNTVVSSFLYNFYQGLFFVYIFRLKNHGSLHRIVWYRVVSLENIRSQKMAFSSLFPL